MENFTPEMIEKAKTAQSAEALLDMAKAGGKELTAEEAKTYFEMLNPKTGELSDDELDAVSGGGCKSKKSGRTVVTNHCKCFTGQWESLIASKYTEGTPGYSDFRSHTTWVRYDNETLRDTWFVHSPYKCGSCRYLEFEGATGVCGKS